MAADRGLTSKRVDILKEVENGAIIRISDSTGATSWKKVQTNGEYAEADGAGLGWLYRQRYIEVREDNKCYLTNLGQASLTIF